MKRVVLVLLVAAFGVTALQELADETRNEEDVRQVGSVSEVVIDVHTRRLDADLGAEALWAACHTVIDFADVVRPLARFDDGAEHHYSVRVSPALGENDRRRLRGCLEDGTVSRVWGGVVSIEPVAAAAQR